MIEKYHTLSAYPEGFQRVSTFDLFSDKNQVDLHHSQICGCRLVHALKSSNTWEVGCAYHVGREVVPRTVTCSVTSSSHSTTNSSPHL